MDKETSALPKQDLIKTPNWLMGDKIKTLSISTREQEVPSIREKFLIQLRINMSKTRPEVIITSLEGKYMIEGISYIKSELEGTYADSKALQKVTHNRSIHNLFHT